VGNEKTDTMCRSQELKIEEGF